MGAGIPRGSVHTPMYGPTEGAHPSCAFLSAAELLEWLEPPNPFWVLPVAQVASTTVLSSTWHALCSWQHPLKKTVKTLQALS